MHSNVWCDKNLCGTNLCDLRLTRINHINKSHAETCRFMVFGNQTLHMYYASKMLASVASDQYKHILEPLAKTMESSEKEFDS